MQLSHDGAVLRDPELWEIAESLDSGLRRGLCGASQIGWNRLKIKPEQVVIPFFWMP